MRIWIFHPILSFVGDWIFHPILSFAGDWIFHPILSFAGDWIFHPILIVWRSSIGRQLRRWVYTRAKYITAEESARFSCFDTNQHLEQDDLPVTKDVNQRVELSRLTADVFQRVENQGFRSNLMSSDLLSSVLMDIQDQWPGGPGQADFAHLAIYWNGCVDGFLLLALCMMGIKRSVGHTDKEGALQNGALMSEHRRPQPTFAFDIVVCSNIAPT